MSSAAGLSCLAHPTADLMAAEDTGIPTCRVCVATSVADLADSWGVVGADGQYRQVSRTEFIGHVQEALANCGRWQDITLLSSKVKARYRTGMADGTLHGPPLQPGEEVLP